MVTLTTNDNQELILMLEQQDAMADAESRRAVLRLAGLQTLLPQINLSGAPFIATSSIVGFLASYGRITYENEALGQFLNTMKLRVGAEQQALIDRLLLRYQMMEPIASSPELDDWQAPDTSETVLEKVFGENTLRPIAFLVRGLQVSRSVAYVSVRSGPDGWSGTGFMITPNLAMTNHHVVSESGILPGVTLRFNYQQDFLGRDLETSDFKAVAGGVFRANKQLDYAIFEVSGEPGKPDAWGSLALQRNGPKTGARINIIQHPGGQPKQISMQNNLVEYVGGHVLQYVTSTLPGSSGSPIFNDNWEVVGLHHAGGRIPEPTTGRYYNRNEGILASKILDDLPTEVVQEIESAASGL
jgi:V8-like Glu-specific endopeptidase